MYPPLPTPTPQTPTETLLAYGARLLTWVIVTGVTATLTDVQLETLEYACTRALTTRVLVGPPDARESTPATVYDTIEDVRRQVCTALRHRQAEAVPTTPVGPATVPPLDGGALSHRLAVPLVRPPSGTAVKIDVAF